MYRAPINPGWDSFGAALAGGVNAGIQQLQAGQLRRQENERYAAEMARRTALDARDAEERNYARALQGLEIGLVDEDNAYETVPAVTARPAGPLAAIIGGAPAPTGPAGPMSAQQRTGPASAIMGGAREAMSATQPATERRLRPGVQQAGNLFFNPQNSLAYGRAEALAESERVRREREQQRVYDRAYNSASHLPEPERRRFATAASLGVDVPQPLEERLAERRATLGVDEEFDIRADDRTERRNLREIAERGRVNPSSGGGRGGGELSVDRATNTIGGVAISFATEALGRDALYDRNTGEPVDPLAFIGGNVRAYVRENGIRLTDGEIMQVVTDQYNKLYKQYQDRGDLPAWAARRYGSTGSRPTTPEERRAAARTAWELWRRTNPNPPAGVVSTRELQNGPDRPVVVVDAQGRSRTQQPPAATTRTPAAQPNPGRGRTQQQPQPGRTSSGRRLNPTPPPEQARTAGRAGAAPSGPLAPEAARQAREYITQSGMNTQQAVARLRQLGRSDAEIRQILPETNPEMFPR